MGRLGVFSYISLLSLVGLAGSGCAKGMFSPAPSVRSSALLDDPNPPTHPSSGPTGSPSSSPTPAPSGSCSLILQNSEEPLRILFMVDNSGSTEQTDKDKFYRVKTVQTFLQNYSYKTNLTYGFGYFTGTGYTYDVNLGSFKSPAVHTFGSATQAGFGLQIFQSLGSGKSGTGYQAAFTAINGAIADDIAASAQEDYAVVFMSDGQPTDLSGNVDNAIKSLVDTLRQTTQSNGKSLLSVSAIYFGDEGDSTSIQHLQVMASEGRGQFVDTNRTTHLSLDNIVSVPGYICTQ